MTIKPLNFSPAQLDNIFSHLQQHTGSVLLDSAARSHSNSNFSVFAWAPKYLIEADLKQSKVFSQDELIETSDADPLELINKYLQLADLSGVKPSVDEENIKDTHVNISESRHDNSRDTHLSSLPFSGGAIGYWDYELGGRFERLPEPRNNDISLPNMVVGIYDTVIVLDHNTEQNYLVCKAGEQEQIFQTLVDLSGSEPEFDNFELQQDWQSNMDKAAYSQKFHQVQEYLLSGDCYQINLAQRFSAPYQGNEWLAYKKLTEVNSAPFSSFIRLKQGAVLSLSPERFLQVSDNKIETKPIKGTRPRAACSEQDAANASDLKQASKDRAENLMIVDLLRNDLSKVAEPGTVEVPKLFDIESFPAVHHLVSTVTANLRAPFTSLDLLRGAFPGGSITGAPKIRAMQIIHELEPDPRSVYCGAIGYIKPNGDMDTNITIRTLVCNQNKIYCWAGGGLVADSKCDDEYQETLDKVNKILPVLRHS